jgi:hypothetical protein
MKVLIIFFITLLFQFNTIAQCDSIFVTHIEIPQEDSLNVLVSINNTNSTQHIYLNLILTDDLTSEVIAESLCGNLVLYPNQVNVYEIDTAAIFCDWQMYYDRVNIPAISNISVHLNSICDSIPWEHTVSITESNNNNAFFIYPNPTKSKLMIKGIQSTPYYIWNSLGETIIKSRTESGEINLQDVPKGVYFIQLEGTPEIQKFIKE